MSYFNFSLYFNDIIIKHIRLRTRLDNFNTENKFEQVFLMFEIIAKQYSYNYNELSHGIVLVTFERSINRLQ